MARMDRKMAGWACVGGAVLFALVGVLLDGETEGDVTADTLLARAANGLFAIAVLGPVAAVWRFRDEAHGSTPRFGIWIALAGLALWIAGGLYLTLDASADQVLTPLGGLVSSIGMGIVGVGAIREPPLAAWRIVPPILVTLWFPVQLPLQLVFFIGPTGTPSYTLLLGGFALVWGIFGLVLATRRSDSHPPAHPRAL